MTTQAPAAWLFCCRHDFESTLRAELARRGLPTDHTRILAPGLVHARQQQLPTEQAIRQWDPVYALQVLPAAQAVIGDSIGQLTQQVVAALPPLWPSQFGRWHVHVLTVGQLKGQPKPLLAPRAELLRRAILKALATAVGRQADRQPKPTGMPELVVQVLLVTAQTAWISISPVVRWGRAMTWPSLVPAGLADPPDEDAAPSSAFRKLREAFAILGNPQPGEQVVDLGASPGGWSHVLQALGCRVTAVDRAELAPGLMANPRIEFVRGDAFRWQPAAPVDGLVSDVIAAPERATQLLQNWCSQRWMRWFVVQLKFKGEPSWDELERALACGRQSGYVVRAKHFFNDKNEVTVMGFAKEEP